MAVTVDVVTEAVRTDTTSPFTWSHGGAASGIKGVIIAAVHGVSSTDHISAVSYGGSALSRIQRNTDTANEPGASELWFLGSSVPQGTQTASVTCGTTTDDFHFVSITLLAAADTEIIDNDGISENVANPSVTLQYSGRSAMAFAAHYGGGADGGSFTPNANCTTIHDHDLGAFYSEVIRQTTAGTADFAIGGAAGSDDVAFAAMAVAEVAANVTVTPGTASLSLSAFAPAVAVSDNKTVTPGTASLSLSAFAPTVTATQHVTVTPGAASIALAAFAPTVTASDHKTVTPGTAALALSAFAPVVSVANNQTVTPGTASLSLATFAPAVSVSDHKLVAPGAAALVLSAFAPVVSFTANQVVTPGAAALVLTAYAPVVTASGEGGGGDLNRRKLWRRRKSCPGSFGI